MIAYLKGKIVDLDFNKAVLLTESGVGYEVGISDITYANISLHSEVELFIYHHRTENSEALFGFFDKIDKKVFEELLKISGVGGKVALQVLSLGVARLATAVRDEDKKTIEQVKGVGKKMAEKILLELKDKDFIDLGLSIKSNNIKSEIKLERSIGEKVKSTLSAMGYNPRDIDRVLEGLPEGLDDLAEIIPFMIKEL
ncbi:MAG: Holliday junction branch migration protein RuvA [Candidatus Gracilibacteria bacterium]|nr:Holliday junction branch migration protein RuvA [Candidatus Gracilibacteria bacterium]